MTADRPPGQPAYAACDWGTSSFRLWLMSAAGKVLGERRSDEGMVKAADKGFAATLDGHLAALAAPRDCPVVMCGMVGARQGWVEAPYVDIPAEIGKIADRAIEAPATGGRRALVLPGVCQRRDGAWDVMRGEETQLLGLALSRPNDGPRLVCLPGTHSKWARLDERGITMFSTFMTGELYALFSAHSVLRHSVREPGEILADDADFQSGLALARDDPASFTGRLFSLRAEDLLTGTAAENLAARLSGLLIGLEIAGARHLLSGLPDVTLIASGPMATLYRTALQSAGLSVTPADAETLVRAGLHAAALQLLDL